MKNSRLHFIWLLLFCCGQFYSYAYGNDSVPNTTNHQLFKPHTSIVDLLPNITFENTKTDDDNALKTSTSNINLRGNYYPWDLTDKLGGGNLGVVAGIHYRNVATQFEQSDNKNASGFFMFEAGVQYGIYLGDWPIRAELTGGIGNYRPATDINASSLAFNFNVATYVPLGESGAFVMPYVGYGSVSNTFKDEDIFIDKVCVNGIILGVSVVRPLGCGEAYCGFSDRVLPSLYRQGTHQSNFLQNGILGFGNALTTSKDFDGEGENSVSGYDVQLAHYYYFLDNLAGGVGLEVGGNSLEPKENSNGKTVNSNVLVKPMVRYNAPSDNAAINNLFVCGGVGFGSNTTKQPDFMGGETKTKNNLFNWEVGVGYNMPFSDHFSALGTFHYINSTSTNSENSDQQTKTSGTRVLFGLAYRWNNN